MVYMSITPNIERMKERALLQIAREMFPDWETPEHDRQWRMVLRGLHRASEVGNEELEYWKRLGNAAQKLVMDAANLALPKPIVVRNSCNRHSDCKAANEAYYAKYGTMAGVNFHCHDDECEDCFGS